MKNGLHRFRHFPVVIARFAGRLQLVLAVVLAVLVVGADRSLAPELLFLNGRRRLGDGKNRSSL